MILINNNTTKISKLLPNPIFCHSLHTVMYYGQKTSHFTSGSTVVRAHSIQNINAHRISQSFHVNEPSVQQLFHKNEKNDAENVPLSRIQYCSTFRDFPLWVIFTVLPTLLPELDRTARACGLWLVYQHRKCTESQIKKPDWITKMWYLNKSKAWCKRDVTYLSTAPIH